MTRFYELPDTLRGLICAWVIIVFILGIWNAMRAVQMKKKLHISISVAILFTVYLTLQVIADIAHRQEGGRSAKISIFSGNICVIWWLLFIGMITAISISLASFFGKWKEDHITQMSVKDSIDRLQAGLCYWEDGGRIILSNQYMDELCFLLTGEILLNGENFYRTIDSECMSLPDGSIKLFLHTLVNFNDKKIHELIAADVTELYKKNEILEQKTKDLQKMNENLKRYNQSMEEIVRKQEILDAKIYIHDEMNRLMLLTTAATETLLSEEEFRRALTLWRNNAILLGSNAERNKESLDTSEIDKLAKLLGINLSFVGEFPKNISSETRELFVAALREAIANAVKHADAKNVTVEMNCENHYLTVVISNDGIMPEGNINLGGGLSNIQRMLETRKGKFRIEYKEQFSVILTIPV